MLRSHGSLNQSSAYLSQISLSNLSSPFVQDPRRKRRCLELDLRHFVLVVFDQRHRILSSATILCFTPLFSFLLSSTLFGFDTTGFLIPVTLLNISPLSLTRWPAPSIREINKLEVYPT